MAILMCSILLSLSNEKKKTFKVVILSSTNEIIWPLCEENNIYEVDVLSDLEDQVSITVSPAYLKYMDAKYLCIYEKKDDQSVEVRRERLYKKKHQQHAPFTNKKSDPELAAARSDWYNRRRGKPKSHEIAQARKRFNSTHKTADTRDGIISSWQELGPDNIGGRTRAIGILSDPNKIIAATAGGGLLTGTFSNSQWNWTPINDFAENPAFSSIAVYHRSPDIVYAATGEFFAKCQGFDCGDGLPGNGIYKSEDGGNTFFKLPNPTGSNMYWITEIAVDPNDPDKLYALEVSMDQDGNVGTDHRIHRSTDGGNTWLPPVTSYTVPITNVSFDLNQVYDLKIDPSDSDRILVSQATVPWNNGSMNILLSTDGGATFVRRFSANGGRAELAYSSSGDTVYASVNAPGGGTVYRSTNSGTNWSLWNADNYICSPTSANNCPGNYSHPIWVDPLDANRVIVGGVDLFMYENGQPIQQLTDWRDYHNGNDSDGDGNVANSLHADHHYIIEAIDYSASNRRVFFANDGGVGLTNNITTVGMNSGWTLMNDNGFSATQFYTGSAHTDVVIGGTQDNAPIFTNSTQANLNWIQEHTGDGAYSVIRPSNKNHFYTSTQLGRLRKTLTGSNTSVVANFNWNCPTPPVSCCSGCTAGGDFLASDSPDFIAPFMLDPNDENSLYFGGAQLWVNSSCWSPSINSFAAIKTGVTGNPDISCIDISKDDSNNIWVGYNNGRLERTTNGGTSWSGDISPPENIQIDFVTDIAVHPHDDDIVAISYGGYNTQNLWVSFNANSANPIWNNISPPSGIQINAVKWHPSDAYQSFLYLGTDFGVLASEDNGDNWSLDPLYTNSEGPVNVEVSDLFWQTSSLGEVAILFAATHGRGMWKSNTLIKQAIYVDKNHTGIEDGSIDFPFNTVQEAVNAADTWDQIIILTSGSHQGTSSFLIDKKIEILLGPQSTGVIIE